VFASHHFNRPANRRISENRGTLLGEFDEKNLTDGTRSERTRSLKDFSDNRQKAAKRRADPSIGAL
jgi:hypothetical protein